MSLLDGAVRLQEPLDQIMLRYHRISELIEKALASISAGDHQAALILSAAVVQKCLTLDSKLGMLNVRDGGGQPRPDGSASSSSSPRRRRRRAA